jgi:hypothetical protein
MHPSLLETLLNRQIVGYLQFLELIQLNIGVFYCNSLYEQEQACDYFFYVLVSPILFLHTSCRVMLFISHC